MHPNSKIMPAKLHSNIITTSYGLRPMCSIMWPVGWGSNTTTYFDFSVLPSYNHCDIIYDTVEV